MLRLFHNLGYNIYITSCG